MRVTRIVIDEELQPRSHMLLLWLTRYERRATKTENAIEWLVCRHEKRTCTRENKQTTNLKKTCHANAQARIRTRRRRRPPHVRTVCVCGRRRSKQARMSTIMLLKLYVLRSVFSCRVVRVPPIRSVFRVHCDDDAREFVRSVRCVCRRNVRSRRCA